jgi:hypothetical protein
VINVEDCGAAGRGGLVLSARRSTVRGMTAAAGPASSAGRPFADATAAQIRAALTDEDAALFDEH